MMIRAREGAVKRLGHKRRGVWEIEVDIEGKSAPAIVYTDLTGCVKEGDRVLLNTTADFLGLGTGGYSFVMANLDDTDSDLSGPGHIMKLRYTPMQVKCLAAEEQNSRFHKQIKDFDSLKGRPVVVVPLHSMLGPLCALVKIVFNDTKIGYVMTDGAALPAAFSKTVHELKKLRLLDLVITAGNAFGGDLETVNFYTGIIAADKVGNCDLIIVGMGPGITGTGTKFGFTGVEQGYIIDGINTLEGLPVVIPRVSFADKRERHKGISHHSLTVLKDIAKTKALLSLPLLEKQKNEYITGQIRKFNIEKKHTVVFNRGDKVIGAMEEFGLQTTTMGRGIDEDRDFFLTVGAAAEVLSEYL